MTTRRLFAIGRVILAVTAMWVGLRSGVANAQTGDGEANFNKLCKACHTIGGGKIVGPDLNGVSDRHSEDWLVKWIASSQSMVHAGDPKAVALFNEYNVMMPDTALSSAEIKDIVAYIKSQNGKPAAAAAPAFAATPEDVRRGRELFQGGTSLTSGGPACSSCHHVTNDNVIGGGVLAKSLTTAFARLGAPGLHAILSAPPFPVMQQAYSTRPLTDGEKLALEGYLQSVSGHPESFDQPREDSLKLLFGGLGGLTVLMGFYSVTWRRRKKSLVNAKIFDRQLRSK